MRKIAGLSAVILLFASFNLHAQFGALGGAAKNKAVEILTNKVMEGLEKKFTELVANEPISDAAKANIVAQLSEMSRPIVKQSIDSAASGKLPNPAELTQAILNDILPRVPDLVAAAGTEGGGGTAGQTQVAANAQLQQNYDDEKDFTVETINEGSAVRIIKYTGKSTELKIPPRIGNRTVAEIGDRVFIKKGLVSVAIPESVIFIGNMAFADNQIGSVSIGANVYIANNAFEISGYNSFSAGFYNSQGRKAGTYNNNWKLVTAAAPASVTQTTTAQKPAAKKTDGSWDAFSIKLNDNIYRLTDRRLFNGRKVVRDETYILKITYTASHDLENDLMIGIIDVTPAAKYGRPLTWGGDIEPARIPASRAGEEVSATITLKTIANATGLSLDANTLSFWIDSKKKKVLTLNITDFVFIREGDTPNVPVQPTAVFAGNGHKYEIIDTKKTWAEAREDCEKRGGYLATITSKEESQFIRDLLSKNGKKSPEYWLGGYREGKKAKENWQWVTGENFTYKNWMPGEPNNSQGKENKLQFWGSTQWNDADENSQIGYICEWE